MNHDYGKRKDNSTKLKSINSNGTLEHENHNMPIWFIKSKHAIYYVLGVIEVMLVFRFILKILGANSQNVFVSFLYSTAGFFAAPFSGIFSSFTPYGLAAKSVFEPAVIIGMVVYAIIAWGIVGLIRIKI